MACRHWQPATVLTQPVQTKHTRCCSYGKLVCATAKHCGLSLTSSQPPPNIAVYHVKSATAKHCCLSRQVSGTAKHCCLSRQVSHRQTLRSVTSSQPPPDTAVSHVKSATVKHAGLSCQVSHRQTRWSVMSSQPPSNTLVCQPSSKHRDLSRQVSDRQTPWSVTSSQPSSKHAATKADQRSRSDTNTLAQVCHCHWYSQPQAGRPTGNGRRSDTAQLRLPNRAIRLMYCTMQNSAQIGSVSLPSTAPNSFAVSVKNGGIRPRLGEIGERGGKRKKKKKKKYSCAHWNILYVAKSRPFLFTTQQCSGVLIYSLISLF